MHKRQVVDRHDCRAGPAQRGHKVGEMRDIRAGQQQLQRHRPLLKAVMRGRVDTAPHHVWRERQRAQVIAVLQRHKFVVASGLGQSRE